MMRQINRKHNLRGSNERRMKRNIIYIRGAAINELNQMKG